MSAPIEAPSGDLQELRARLRATGWTRHTSADPDNWTPERPSYGQCAVSALVVQDRFGGQLLRTVNAGTSHYFNQLPDGREVDLTRDQFDRWAPTEPPQPRSRQYVLSHPATVVRYELLRTAIA